MKKIEFVVLDDGDTIQPSYACGLKDKSVGASWHGERWASWKLIDMLQKHIDKCDVCKRSIRTMDLDQILTGFDGFVMAMKEIGDAAKRTTKIMAAFIEAMKVELGATPIDEEEEAMV